MENRISGSVALLVAASLFISIGCRQQEGTQSAANLPAEAPVSGELVVAATLEEIPGQFPPNEIYNYAYIMRYRIDSVLQGSVEGANLLIGHYNPRFPRDGIKDDQDSLVGGNVKSFTRGDRHYLVLTPLDKVWAGAVEDEFYKDKAPRYWAKWADRL